MIKALCWGLGQGGAVSFWSALAVVLLCFSVVFGWLLMTAWLLNTYPVLAPLMIIVPLIYALRVVLVSYRQRN